MLLCLLRPLFESNASALPRGGVSRLQFKALPTVFRVVSLSESNATVLPRGVVSRRQFKALPSSIPVANLSESNASVLARRGLQAVQ
jgi:hypothetical protein